MPIEHDDGLTEEERAALAEPDTVEGDDDNEDDATDTQNVADDSDVVADDVTDDDDDSADEADDPPVAPVVEPARAAEVEQPASAPQQSAPLLVAAAPEDADAKLADIASKKEQLVNQFDDGEITGKEYQTQLDALAKQEREIELALHKAQIAAEMEQQRLANEWRRDVSSFIAAHESYSPEKNPRLYRMLDQEVRDVAVTDEGRNMTGAQILAKAHANLVEAGLVRETKAAEAAPRAKVPKQPVPPSLHGMPAAETNDVTGGKYANLDRLAQRDPVAYEEALMKLPEAERNAYLAST